MDRAALAETLLAHAIGAVMDNPPRGVSKSYIGAFYARNFEALIAATTAILSEEGIGSDPDEDGAAVVAPGEAATSPRVAVPPVVPWEAPEEPEAPAAPPARPPARLTMDTGGARAVPDLVSELTRALMREGFVVSAATRTPEEGILRLYDPKVRAGLLATVLVRPREIEIPAHLDPTLDARIERAAQAALGDALSRVRGPAMAPAAAAVDTAPGSHPGDARVRAFMRLTRALKHPDFEDAQAIVGAALAAQLDDEKLFQQLAAKASLTGDLTWIRSVDLELIGARVRDELALDLVAARPEQRAQRVGELLSEVLPALRALEETAGVRPRHAPMLDAALRLAQGQATEEEVLEATPAWSQPPPLRAPSAAPPPASTRAEAPPVPPAAPSPPADELAAWQARPWFQRGSLPARLEQQFEGLGHGGLGFELSNLLLALRFGDEREQSIAEEIATLRQEIDFALPRPTAAQNEAARKLLDQVAAIITVEPYALERARELLRYAVRLVASARCLGAERAEAMVILRPAVAHYEEARARLLAGPLEPAELDLVRRRAEWATLTAAKRARTCASGQQSLLARIQPAPAAAELLDEAAAAPPAAAPPPREPERPVPVPAAAPAPDAADEDPDRPAGAGPRIPGEHVQRGMRVVLRDGAHGTVERVYESRTSTRSYGDREWKESDEVRYHFHVRRDSGRTEYEWGPLYEEVGPPPEAIPDVSFDGGRTLKSPEDAWKEVDAAYSRPRTLEAAAGRARLPERKRELQQEAQRALKVFRDKYATWEHWRTLYPLAPVPGMSPLRARQLHLEAHPPTNPDEQAELVDLQQAPPNWETRFEAGDTVMLRSLEHGRFYEEHGWRVDGVTQHLATISHGALRREVPLWRLHPDRSAPVAPVEEHFEAPMYIVEIARQMLPNAGASPGYPERGAVARALKSWLAEHQVSVSTHVSQGSMVSGIDLSAGKGQFTEAELRTIDALLPNAHVYYQREIRVEPWQKDADPYDAGADYGGKRAGLLVAAAHIPRFAQVLAGAMKAAGQTLNRLGERRLAAAQAARSAELGLAVSRGGVSAEARQVAAEGCLELAFDMAGYGHVRVVCGQQGRRDVWHNIYVGSTRYGYNGGRWAKGMKPPEPVLEAVRERGVGIFV